MATKREKILLGCVGTAALVAAGVLLWPSGRPRQDQVKLEEVSKGARDMATAMARLKLTKVEDYVLARSSQPWSPDPFAAQPVEPAGREAGKGSQAAPAFVYSGFIDAGSRRLAIINGIEYAAGEQLESGGYLVEEIGPDQVVLEEIGRKAKISVPYQDTSFFAQ